MEVPRIVMSTISPLDAVMGASMVILIMAESGFNPSFPRERFHTSPELSNVTFQLDGETRLMS